MLEIGQFVGMPIGGTLLIIMMVWVLVWKGFALWKAARAGSKVWFIIILLVNTLGILEIIYIFAVKPRIKFNFKTKTEEGK